MKKKLAKKAKKKCTFLRTLFRIAGALIACAAAAAAVCCVIKKFTKKVCSNSPSEKNDSDDAELNELLDSIKESEASDEDVSTEDISFGEVPADAGSADTLSDAEAVEALAADPDAVPAEAI